MGGTAVPLCSHRLCFTVLALVAALPVLAACSGAPWVDARREGGQVETVGESTKDRPAICFAPGETSAETLLSMAQEVCAETGRTAVYVGTAKWQCRMTTPHRAFFECR